MAWGICNVRTHHPKFYAHRWADHVNSMPSTSTASRAGSRRAKSALSTIGTGSSRNMVVEPCRTGSMLLGSHGRGRGFRRQGRRGSMIRGHGGEHQDYSVARGNKGGQDSRRARHALLTKDLCLRYCPQEDMFISAKSPPMLQLFL